MLPVGTQLGHYRILNLIKRGGMGEVYQAEDTRLPRQVAIKIIQSEPTLYPNPTASQDAARLFNREMAAIAKLDHPNILPLIDFGEQTIDASQITYMVMPLRSGGSLNDWLRQRASSEPLPVDDVAYLIGQAASALTYAHAQGFIHQDVKPSNFLVQERSEQPLRPTLQLADFGVAKIAGTSKSSRNVRGTLEYMSPEQLDGRALPASDQYALAIMAYELLTGRVPFNGTPTQLMTQHANSIPVAPSTINPHVHAQVDDVILRALAKDPAKRFSSTVEFSHAFDLALQHKSADVHNGKGSVPPDPVDTGYVKTKFMAGNNNIQSADTLSYNGSTAKTERIIPPPSTPKFLTIFILVLLLVLIGSMGVFFAAMKKNTDTASPGNTGVPTQPLTDITATAQAIADAATAQANVDATAQANADAAAAQANADATATAQAIPPPTQAPSVINIAGNYAGTVHNANSNISAKMTLVIQQDQSNIGGNYTEYYPLAPGGGPISGNTGTDSNGHTYVQFTVQFVAQGGAACGSTCTMDFQGYLYKDGSLRGTYTISDGESGTWAVIG